MTAAKPRTYINIQMSIFQTKRYTFEFSMAFQLANKLCITV